ncbi:hypothetical protein QN277_025134 [Acacia crassicarpa]|uniref:Uncharacterized protein n=1 Tax=Acacia crassicarpa TaxID=499986 RepID=A0AAE1ML15_9FABA|nr:hypothetical protein QN277_025134 [Acacia crassicarpa]
MFNRPLSFPSKRRVKFSHQPPHSRLLGFSAQCLISHSRKPTVESDKNFRLPAALLVVAPLSTTPHQH